MTSIFDQGLDKNIANFVALSPVSFVERSAEIFGDLPAVIHGKDATTGRRHVSAQRDWLRLSSPKVLEEEVR